MQLIDIKSVEKNYVPVVTMIYLLVDGCVLGFSSSTVMFLDLSHDVRKPVTGFPTSSDTNRTVQLQNVARGLKFQIQ